MAEKSQVDRLPVPGDPHRRMGRLDGTGPEVDHPELLVLAVPGEHLLRRPRLDDEVVGLVVALPLLDRRDPVDHVGVHRAAERHAGDEAAAADAVDHGVLLGHPDRRVGRRQGGAHLDERHVQAVGGPGEGRTHQIGPGHEPVGVLMVLVDADAVQPRLGGVGQLVERPVVVLAHTHRVGQLVPGRIDPDGLVPPFEVVRQLPVRHEMEHRDLHAKPPRELSARVPPHSCPAPIVRAAIPAL